MKLPNRTTFGSFEPADYHKGCTVLGWGKTSENSPASDSLNKIYLPLIRNANCEDKLYPVGYLMINQMCAILDGDIVGGTCPGDSGGPLVCDNMQVCLIPTPT